jgi:carbonic anhydrase/acetyltransferase-like protein (isoleucine patch superfamily)
MHQAVIRGDLAPIRIGNRVNFQDGAIVHTDIGVSLEIEDDVGVGHGAVVHCRSIGAGTLIGIGSIILDDCRIGGGCIGAAGAVVPPGTVVPDGKVVMGVPAAVVRDTTAAEAGYLQEVIRTYIELGRRHAEGRYPKISRPGDRPGRACFSPEAG